MVRGRSSGRRDEAAHALCLNGAREEKTGRPSKAVPSTQWLIYMLRLQAGPRAVNASGDAGWARSHQVAPTGSTIASWPPIRCLDLDGIRQRTMYTERCGSVIPFDVRLETLCLETCGGRDWEADRWRGREGIASRSSVIVSCQHIGRIQGSVAENVVTHQRPFDFWTGEARDGSNVSKDGGDGGECVREDVSVWLWLRCAVDGDA